MQNLYEGGIKANFDKMLENDMATIAERIEAGLENRDKKAGISLEEEL